MERLHIQMNQATSLFYTADYEESKILFQQLLKTFTKNKDIHGMLRCYYRLACLTYTRGEIALFHHYSEKYSTLFTSFLAKNIEHYIEHNMLLGLQAMVNLKHSRAIPFFAAVVDQATAKFKKHKISAMLFIQKCQITLGNFDQAEMMDDQLDDYIREMKEDVQQILHLYLNRAYFALLQQDMVVFEQYILLAKQHPEYSFLLKEPVFIAILKAKQLALQGDYVKAIKRLQSTTSKYDSVKDPQLLYMIYTAFIEYYEQIQNHKEALHYAKLLMALERTVSV